eukprot:1041814-Lingulodinium_polyedra.AAC.1
MSLGPVGFTAALGWPMTRSEPTSGVSVFSLVCGLATAERPRWMVLLSLESPGLQVAPSKTVPPAPLRVAGAEAAAHHGRGAPPGRGGLQR